MSDKPKQHPIKLVESVPGFFLSLWEGNDILTHLNPFVGWKNVWAARRAAI